MWKPGADPHRFGREVSTLEIETFGPGEVVGRREAVQQAIEHLGLFRAQGVRAMPLPEARLGQQPIDPSVSLFQAVQQAAAEIRSELLEYGVASTQIAEAIRLYRSAGYREVSAFNDDPYANHWFEKTLAGPPRVRRRTGARSICTVNG